MFFHGHRERACGRRGQGRWSRGPFFVQWEVASGEDGGRGRRRVFDSGELRLVLLKLIADQPRHGYDLIREIEALSGGGYAPSPGVVYPTLTLLDDMDLIAETKSEGVKKQFAITAAGTAHLAERGEEVAGLFARLAEMNAERARSDNSSIRRAMGNLRTVLHNRLGEADVDADALHEMVAILDEAARRIERLGG